jgi:hypothetical protein
VDSEAVGLPKILQPIHEAAVAATLATQWDVLSQDEEAKLLLRVAGQFTEAAVIPMDTLGLLAGASHVASTGHVSDLESALARLHDVRLVKELLKDRVRLHPLIREFARDLTPPSETETFRHNCARRVAQAYEDFARLEETFRREGCEELDTSLKTALSFASESGDDVRESLRAMLRTFQREGHQLRDWDPGSRPAGFAQQVLFRAQTTGETSLAARAEHRLKALARPYIALRWRTYRESAALVRLLTGHQREVRSVAVSPDGRHAVSGSSDGTVAVWDLQTGERLRTLAGHQGEVRSVVVSPGGRHAVSGSFDGTVAVWDFQTGERLRTLAGHQGEVRSVAVDTDQGISAVLDHFECAGIAVYFPVLIPGSCA